MKKGANSGAGTTAYNRRWEKSLRKSSPPRRLAETPQLATLKNRMLREHLHLNDPSLSERLRNAAEEAASLAWATPFPLLAFPELLEEKVAQARRRAEHQWKVLSQSPAAYAVAE